MLSSFQNSITKDCDANFCFLVCDWLNVSSTTCKGFHNNDVHNCYETYTIVDKYK